MAGEVKLFGGGYTLTKARISRIASGVQETWNGTAWVAYSTISAGDFGSLGVVDLSTSTLFGEDVFTADFDTDIDEAGTYYLHGWDGTPTKGTHRATQIILWDGDSEVDAAALGALADDLASVGQQVGLTPYVFALGSV